MNKWSDLPADLQLLRYQYEQYEKSGAAAIMPLSEWLQLQAQMYGVTDQAPGIKLREEEPMKSAFAIARELLRSLMDLDVSAADPLAEETSIPYLKWMCDEILLRHTEWQSDKTHRWIGYIQGVMCSKGWSSVDRERDRVRAVAEEGDRPPENLL